jgi:hypothetical protein
MIQMLLSRYALAAAVSALLAGAAYAADNPPASSADQTPPAQSTTPPATPDTNATPPADTAAPPADTTPAPAAPAATEAAANTSATVGTQVVASAPVPDTPENRAKYGGPMSRAGKRTAPKGN